MATKKESPMMKQFRELKAKHPETLLLFRCGDFYESYEDDAKECARVLGITLTKRSSDGTAMAGFPHHALDTYLPKLIRAGKRVAICDQLEDPKLTNRLVKRGITELVSPATNNSNNIQNNSTMETKTMTAQDYVGKTINVNGSNNFYVVKSGDGDKLTAEFHMGDRVMPCPIPMSQLKAMVDAGKWTICAEVKTVPEPIAEEPKPVTEKPTAQTVTMKPIEPKKPKRQPKPTKSVEKPEDKDSKPETKAKRRYETYTNKKGKTCARIVGFTEGDAMLERGNAERIHASSTYERDKKGVKHYMLIFGPRYADAAKEVCRALNEGKTLDDCQAIIDAATEERVQKREEWKAKRAAYLANRENEGAEVKPIDVKHETKGGYSSKDVAAMLKKIMDGGAIPDEIKRAMAV